METRKFVALATLALIAASGYAAGNRAGVSALGFIETHGEVKVDNLAVPPATALFPGDRISTGAASAAVLKLGWGASVILGRDSSLNLPRNGALRRLDLNGGVAIVQSAGGNLTRVRVSGSEVKIGGGQFPALCRIALLEGQASVLAQSGRVEVSEAGRRAILSPGKWFHLNANPQAGAPGQKAGSVTAEIPTAVRHPSQTPQASVPLQLRSEVDWQDLVQTLQNGRVRITLLDGSVLNVGADASMHIIEHRPQEQQTTIQLTLGHMRAEVKKLTQPNGHFRVQTQTAVIGVVGTIFIVQALDNATHVWCIQGKVVVWNIVPAVAGKVTLHPGQSTTVFRGVPPTSPVQAPLAQMQDQVNQTNVVSVPGAQVVPGVTETPISLTTTAAPNLALSGAELGGAGSAAAMSGVALSRLNNANNAAQQALSNAQAALTAADNAATNASNAAIAAANAAAVAQAAAAAASTALPTGCGCGP